MTPDPECATVETTILEALHIMRDGKFLHLPVVDKGVQYFYIFFFILKYINIILLADGCVASCLDVLQITHAAISMVIFFLYIVIVS